MLLKCCLGQSFFPLQCLVFMESGPGCNARCDGLGFEDYKCDSTCVIHDGRSLDTAHKALISECTFLACLH